MVGLALTFGSAMLSRWCWQAEGEKGFRFLSGAVIEIGWALGHVSLDAWTRPMVMGFVGEEVGGQACYRQ